MRTPITWLWRMHWICVHRDFLFYPHQSCSDVCYLYLGIRRIVWSSCHDISLGGAELTHRYKFLHYVRRGKLDYPVHIPYRRSKNSLTENKIWILDFFFFKSPDWPKKCLLFCFFLLCHHLQTSVIFSFKTIKDTAKTCRIICINGNDWSVVSYKQKNI